MSTMEDNIPDQQKGTQKNFEQTVVASTIEEAEGMFAAARTRLMNINEWHSYAGMQSATFKLTDEHRENVYRTAEKNDYVKIDIPGPSPVTETYDWVQIVEVKYDMSAAEQSESILIALKPVTAPNSDKSTVTHFFGEDASSTFLLKREAKAVSIHYYGRNETPNIDTSNILDKVRNVFVGISAILGFSDMQWQLLIKGIIRC